MKPIITTRISHDTRQTLAESPPTRWGREGAFGSLSSSGRSSCRTSYHSCEEPAPEVTAPPRLDEEAFERQFELQRDKLLEDLSNWATKGGASERLGRSKAATHIRGCLESRRPQLYLGNLNLSSLPLIVFHLRFLRQLHLGGNSLRALPEAILNLEHLTHLTLGGNLLIDLPDQIGRLEKLEVLDLSANWLKHLPPSIAKLTSLHYLHLHTNPIIALPDAIGQLPADCTVTMWRPHDGVAMVRVKEHFRFPGKPDGPVILK